MHRYVNELPLSCDIGIYKSLLWYISCSFLAYMSLFNGTQNLVNIYSNTNDRDTILCEGHLKNHQNGIAEQKTVMIWGQSAKTKATKG